MIFNFVLKCFVFCIVASESHRSEDGRNVGDDGKQLSSSNQDPNWKCI